MLKAKDDKSESVKGLEVHEALWWCLRYRRRPWWCPRTAKMAAENEALKTESEALKPMLKAKDDKSESVKGLEVHEAQWWRHWTTCRRPPPRPWWC